MILASLHRLATDLEVAGRLPPTAYRERKVGWVLRLRADGTPDTPALVARPEDAGRLTTPDQYRSGITPPPLLCVDKAEYVLGCSGHPDETDDDAARTRRAQAEVKAAQRHQAFASLHHAAGQAYHDGPLAVVSAFLEDMPPLDIPEDLKPSDWVAIAIDGTYVHEHPDARAYWVAHTAARARHGTCAITGVSGPVVALWPTALTAFGKAKISSQNHNTFIDLRGGKPAIGYETSIAITAALDHLLTDPDHHRRLGDDTRLVWWLDHDVDTNPLAVLFDAPSLDDVNRLLASPRTGRPTAITPGAFHALHLSARNDARVIFHTAIDTTVAVLAERLRRWLTDVTIPSRNDLFRPTVGQIAWHTAPGDSASARAHRGRIEAALVMAALTDAAPPRWILKQAVTRALTPSPRRDNDTATRVPDALAAVLQIHHRRTHKEEPMPLDHSTTDPAYLLGRVIAITEHIQTTHLDHPNRTVADRVMRTAATRPAAALPILEKTARVHLRGLTSKGKGGFAISLKRRLDDALALMPPTGPPTRFSTEQRARLVLGYHHQRHDLFTKSQPTPSPEKNEAV